MIGSAKQLPELKKRTLSKKQASKLSNRLGTWGESQAATYLTQKGYQILAQNVQLGQFEIDIVALDVQNQELVFVEVKTRSAREWGEPVSAINHRKLIAMKKAAWQYVQAKSLDCDFRFDVVSILPGDIQHFENITW